MWPQNCFEFVCRSRECAPLIKQTRSILQANELKLTPTIVFLITIISTSVDQQNGRSTNEVVILIILYLWSCPSQRYIQTIGLINLIMSYIA